MGIEIPPAFVAYAEERGCEVHRDTWVSDEGEPREEVMIRKHTVVRDKIYSQALIIHEQIFRYPDRWELLFDMLESSLGYIVGRGEAHLN